MTIRTAFCIKLKTRALDHHRWYIKEFPEYKKFTALGVEVNKLIFI